ncbi:helix-turn-helix domain-containing protein [Methylocystis sp. Sn-Cys]|uniref:helix-turn-helix domain-containing protein n=1 Tax=Methylocystis sp. Sn-Cys TaxID=1701263 RepID=UPI001924C5A7|nr:helix-turn-helix domain-containing protein [Methylocystis sp. Sn-Cys]MBL1258005.1 helix-turn-helix domain-containing protein [Methylocystis sp. Sn-Cys]
MNNPKLRNASPLVVSPRDACVMLDIGPTKLWALINSGEVESYLDGSRRKIIVASIQRYVERLRAQVAAVDALPKKTVGSLRFNRKLGGN